MIYKSGGELNDIVPFFALGDFFGFVFLVGGHVIHFQIFHAHAGVCAHGTGDECVAADDCVFGVSLRKAYIHIVFIGKYCENGKK